MPHAGVFHCRLAAVFLVDREVLEGGYPVAPPVAPVGGDLCEVRRAPELLRAEAFGHLACELRDVTLLSCPDELSLLHAQPLQLGCNGSAAFRIPLDPRHVPPVPRLGPQCGGELRAPVDQDRVAVGDEHALGTEIEQRLQRRNEAIAVPARARLAVEVVLPDPQAPARLDHGVAESERLVRGDPERLLLAARAADSVRAHAGGELGLRRDRMEAGALCESAGTRLVSPDRAAPAVLSA